MPAKSEDGKPYIGGVWLVEKPQAEAKTAGGQGAAPEARGRGAVCEAQAGQGRRQGADDPVEQCLPHGVPRLLSAAQPIQILQKPKQITVLYQANHQSRLFYIDEPVPATGRRAGHHLQRLLVRAMGRAMRWSWTPSG